MPEKVADLTTALPVTTDENRLFPIFLKAAELRFLIVGGGAVAVEKLTALLSNEPDVTVHLVAKTVRHEILAFAKLHAGLTVAIREYRVQDLQSADLILVAVEDKALSATIRADARDTGKLINVADTPDLCDFYLGSIVKKGNLKIAISTNGKSPTVAKRLKEVLFETLPEELEDVLKNMQQIRTTLKGDFTEKVKKLNNLTAVLVPRSSEKIKRTRLHRSSIVWVIIVLAIIASGTIFFTVHASMHAAWLGLLKTVRKLDHTFYWMLVTGFTAQVIAGALGMGYGVICTTILLSLGINLPAISSSIHTAETFASGVGGYSHYRFGNVNRKLFKALLIPGILGAITGAVLLSLYGDRYAAIIKPIMALYTLFLGIKILLNAFRHVTGKRKSINIPFLAATGGFIDSFGGGGWGPLVTSSFIATGRSPKFVVGSVSLAKFFVTLASASTFFVMLGMSKYWLIIAGLLLGGITAAPLAARIAGLLPKKTMFISVGVLVILCSLRLLFKSFF